MAPARKAAPNRTSAAAVDNLQGLVDQVQALRRRHKGRPSAQSAAELARLRGLLLEALDLDEGEADDAGETDDYDTEDEDDEWDEDGPGGWGGRGDWARFTPARPIAVEAGLAVRSRRGAIGETWWSKRFLDAVESALVGGRLARGRTYARQGQVMELQIGAGLISARVQGTRQTPYKVRVAMPAASDAKWEKIVAALASQAVYAARLLAGELPHEMEAVFAEAGVALLPARTSRLATDCTCPDWANPCKHVAAVCYLVAEALDVDPFLLLAFRGRTREALLTELRLRRGTGAGADGDPVPVAAEPILESPPLADCVLGFWKAGPELAEVQCRPRASEVPGAVLRQLQRGTLEVRGRDVVDLLDPAYARLGHHAERRAFGSAPRTRSDIT